MGLQRMRARLRAGSDELHRSKLRDEWSGHDVTPMAQAADRAPVRVGGEVQGTHVVPRPGSPTVEVRLSDGTGEVVAVFTGRRSIGGVVPGRRMVVDGFGRRVGDRLVVMNPAYTLLP